MYSTIRADGVTSTLPLDQPVCVLALGARYIQVSHLPERHNLTRNLLIIEIGLLLDVDLSWLK
jgi:hypothetical protein